MPKKLSVVTAVFCSFLFPNLKCALMAWSDIPFLFFSLTSFFFVFKVIKTEGKEQIIYCLLAGLSSGCSVLLRNVGYAVVLSAGFGFLLMIGARMVPFKKFIRMVLMFGLGFLIMMAPYMVRNYIVFGRINPFGLPPANVTFIQNWKDYSHTLANMLFANPFYDIFLLAIIGGMGIWFLARIKHMIQMDRKTFFCACVLGMYFFSGSFLLLLSKTLYFMPEQINERYLIQYVWIIIGGLSYGVFYLLVKLKKSYPMDIEGIVAIILMVFFIIQVFPASDFYFYQKTNLRLAEKVKRAVILIEKIPKDYIIVSNVADMASFFSGRSTRMLNGYMPQGLKMFLGNDRKFAVLIVKQRDENFWFYLYPMSWLNPEGYQFIYSDDDIVLWLPDAST
jgi:hypothetical protein